MAKHLPFAFVFVMAIVALQAREAGEGRIHRVTLPNGIRLIHMRMRRVPLVEVNETYRAGSWDDPKGKAGLAHLVEHLRYDRPARRALGEIDGGATTHSTTTEYFGIVRRSMVEASLAWINRDLTSSSLREEDFELERRTVLNERRERLDDYPDVPFHFAVLHALYGEDPRGDTGSGSNRSIAGLTLEDVREFRRRYYVPSNCTIVITGDISWEEALEAAERVLTAPPAPTPVRRFDPLPRLAEGPVRSELLSQREPARVVAWPAIDPDSRASAALEVFLPILAERVGRRLPKTAVSATVNDSLIALSARTLAPGFKAAVEDELRLPPDAALLSAELEKRIATVRQEIEDDGLWARAERLQRDERRGIGGEGPAGELDFLRSLSPMDVRAAIEANLHTPPTEVESVPVRAYASVPEPPALPSPGHPPPLIPRRHELELPRFAPAIRQFTSPEGLRIVIVPDRDVKTVRIRVVLPWRATGGLTPVCVRTLGLKDSVETSPEGAWLEIRAPRESAPEAIGGFFENLSHERDLKNPFARAVRDERAEQHRLESTAASTAAAVGRIVRGQSSSLSSTLPSQEMCESMIDSLGAKNMILVIHGQVDERTLLTSIEKPLSKMRHDAQPAAFDFENPAVPQGNLFFVDFPGATVAHVEMSGPWRGAGADYFSGPAVLYELAWSHLNSLLSDRLAAVYGVSSGFVADRDRDAFSLSFATAPSTLELALDSASGELDSLAREGFDDAEVDSARANAALSAISHWSSPPNALEEATGIALGYHSPDEIREVEKFDSVAADALARDYFDPQGMKILVVGDRRTVLPVLERTARKTGRSIVELDRKGDPIPASSSTGPDRLHVSQWWSGAVRISRPYGCSAQPEGASAGSTRCPPGAPYFHHGIDLDLSCDAPLISPWDAILISIGMCGKDGGVQCPRLQLSDGYDVLLFHVENTSAQGRALVRRGERFATVGNLGAAMCGLHFEVRPGGAGSEDAVDPRPWLGDDFIGGTP